MPRIQAFFFHPFQRDPYPVETCSEIIGCKRSPHSPLRVPPPPYRTEAKQGQALPQKHSYGFAQEPRHTVVERSKFCLIKWRTNCWVAADLKQYHLQRR